MATYAGVTFDLVMSDPRQRPGWSRQATIVQRIVPYSGKEDVQSVGLGNWKITVPITVTSTSDLATLQAAQGVTKRTLGSFFGDSYSDVMLTEVGPPSFWEFETRMVVECTFIREGE